MRTKTFILLFLLTLTKTAYAQTTITYTPYISNDRYDVYESYGPPSGRDSSYYGIGSSYEYYSPNSTIIIKDRVIPNYRPRTVYYIERPRNPPKPNHENNINGRK